VLGYGDADDVLVGRYRGLLEAIEVCRQADIPLHIAHIPNAFLLPLPHPDYLEQAAARATMDIVDQANADGVTVTCDVILPPRSQTVKAIIKEFQTERFDYPDWLLGLSREELVESLKTQEFRAKIRELYDGCRVKFSMIHTKIDPYWMNCLMVVKHKNAEYENKLVSEIAKTRNTDALEAVFDLIVEDPEAKWVAYHDRRYNQAAVSEFMKHPLCEPCTDDYVLPESVEALGIDATASAAVTATSFGMYPYYIKTYVKELGVMTLEEAVRKATSLPAKRLGLNRGTLSPGVFADIVVFDFEKIDMKVDFLKPDQRPEGIEYVFVNGKVAYQDKAHTGERAGKVLRKSL
jgi:N-acyl-D-aspartate/D-glutamate deacylase